MDDRKDIFISYRRNGGEWLAYCLYSELILAGYSVFFDMRSLMGGKFEADIIKRIKESKVVIVVLPPKALDRCANKDDLVFEEIRTAIDSDKLVVPVFMKGFELPDKSLFAQEEVKDRYKYFRGSLALRRYSRKSSNIEPASHSFHTPSFCNQ